MTWDAFIVVGLYASVALFLFFAGAAVGAADWRDMKARRDAAEARAEKAEAHARNAEDDAIRDLKQLAVVEADRDTLRADRDRLAKALRDAASSLEWIAHHGIDDEDPMNLRLYAEDRARVARARAAEGKGAP